MKSDACQTASLYYCFLSLEYIANPIVPNASPATDAPHAKKLKKNVDSSTWMTIKKGRAMARNIRSTPRLRRKRGEFIIYLRGECYAIEAA